MRSFHHPPPCLEAGLSLDGLGLFPSRADMGGKAELAQDVAHLVVIIPFVQTHSLRVFFAWLWTCDDDAFDGRAHQFHIMAIGSLNRQTEGHAMPFGEQAAFDPALASIRGIGTSFFPRPRALWSSP